jgi:apolipoprotein D and lipocalin family protein
MDHWTRRARDRNPRRDCPGDSHEEYLPMPVKWLTAVFLGALVAACGTTSSLPPLRGIPEPVDLERFMGPWYVIASIPIDIPLLPMFSEKGAHNGVETYRLAADGTIETTYVFRRGGFDGPERTFTPKARVANAPVNSEWKMKFDWYLPEADYLILSLDPDYQRTVIGVPDRKYVWIMSRTPTMPEAEYAILVEGLRASGYDTDRLERVPQRWPD